MTLYSNIRNVAAIFIALVARWSKGPLPSCSLLDPTPGLSASQKTWGILPKSATRAGGRVRGLRHPPPQLNFISAETASVTDRIDGRTERAADDGDASAVQGRLRCGHVKAWTRAHAMTRAERRGGEEGLGGNSIDNFLAWFLAWKNTRVLAWDSVHK